MVAIIPGSDPVLVVSNFTLGFLGLGLIALTVVGVYDASHRLTDAETFRLVSRTGRRSASRTVTYTRCR